MTADLPPLELYLHWFNFRYRHRRPPGFDVHALIDTAARLGFSGVNLWVKGPEYYFLGGADEPHLDAIRRRLDRHGLGIDLETHGTEPAHLEAVLGIARRLRADHLRTYTLRRPDPREQIESAVRDLRIVAPVAARAGVRLLLENHEDLTATQVAEILARVDHPQLGALFDYGNSAVFIEEPAESLRVLARHSRTAHLKDHVTIPAGAAGNAEPLWLGVPLGEGHLPVIATTQALRAAGCRRVCFENCWAYHTGFRDRRGTGELGRGVYVYRPPPYDPRVCLIGAHETGPSGGLDLPALESQTFADSVCWLARNFAAAGIPLARPLQPAA